VRSVLSKKLFRVSVYFLIIAQALMVLSWLIPHPWKLVWIPALGSGIVGIAGLLKCLK